MKMKMPVTSKTDKAKATTKPFDKATKGGKMPPPFMKKMMAGKKMGRGK